MPGLPSWVRDFSQMRPLGVVAVEERRIIYASLYQASVQQPVAPLLNEIREFHYKRAYAKTVKAVGQQITASDTALPQVFSQWHELCREAMGPCEWEVLHNKFFHILCGDVSKSPHEGAAFRGARETDIPEDGWDRLMDGDLYTVPKAMAGAYTLPSGADVFSPRTVENWGYVTPILFWETKYGL